MLVAAPGQTAAYLPTTLHSNSSSSGGNSGVNSAPKKTCHTTSSSVVSFNKLAATESSSVAGKSNSSAISLMKTLSVRLSRSSEILKSTMQKALIINSALNATSDSSSAAPNISTWSAKVNANTNSTNLDTSSEPANRVPTTAKVAGAACYSRSNTNTTSSTSATVLHRLYTVPPTVIHRYPAERLQASSVDSLHKEMCHFKPIRPAPATLRKCGSKSRGAALKRPKANLATQNHLNLNCDEEQESGTGGFSEEKSADEEAEEKNQYKNYRPKPSSTFLRTLISTPEHQSAFVCLVAQMKNLAATTTANSKSKANLKMASDLHKSLLKGVYKRNPRTLASTNRINKSKTSVATTASSASTVREVTRKERAVRRRRNPFVHVKKIHLPAELIIGKSLRNARPQNVLQQASAAAVTSASKKNPVNRKSNTSNNTKIQDFSKSKSKSSLQATKSKVSTLATAPEPHVQAPGKVESKTSVAKSKAVVKKASKTIGLPPKRMRKRKIVVDLTEGEESTHLLPRKNARISKDCSKDNSKETTTSLTTTSATATKASAASAGGSESGVGGSTGTATHSKKPKRSHKNKKKVVSARASPPLTRSRLKQMANGNLFAALDYTQRI